MNRGSRGAGNRSNASKSSIQTIATNLGIEKQDLRSPPPSFHPPLLYPHLEKKPLPVCLESDFYTKEELEYVAELKAEFLSAMQNASSYSGDADDNKKMSHIKIERYTDRLKKTKRESSFQPKWNRLPYELWPIKLKRKLTDDSSLKRTHKHKMLKIDPVVQLKLLEDREITEDSIVQKQIGDPDDDNHSDIASDDEKTEKRFADLEEAEEDEQDEEEFNDYAETYFDNGEEFEENSEDNLDDQNTF